MSALGDRKLTLVAKRTAVAYEYHGAAFGWAICTVSDATGELSIQSDWGNWQYRWDPNPKCLGHATLTEFIAKRGDVDYIARKLQREGKLGMRWSADGTVRELRKLLVETRLDHARQRGVRRMVRDHSGVLCDVAPLTKEMARYLWNELGYLAVECEDNPVLFDERYRRNGDFARYVTGEHWHYAVREQTPEDKALRDIVLPALIATLKDSL